MKSCCLGLLLLAVGCGTSVQSSRNLKPRLEAPPDAWQGVERVAVLPPDNWTTDVGLEYIAWYRAVINDSLRRKGYRTTPLTEVNRFLRRNRFMMAGEVRQYEMNELAQEFRADALLFWNITGPGPKIEMFLVKADGTDLWATGEVVLGLPYNAIPAGAYAGNDSRFAMALSEIVWRIPEKR